MAEDNRDIVRSLYECWNARELERAAEHMLEEGEVVLVGSGTRMRGPDGLLEFQRLWADAFPDARVSVDHLVAAGDLVCAECAGRGTHTGTLRLPAGEIPPSGQAITWHRCDVYEFRGGKIRLLRSYFDSLAILEQLGAKPELALGARA
jgi:predicted ester cyclase